MPTRERRTRYPVVSWTVVGLAGVSALALLARRQIIPQEINAMKDRPEEYLRAASSQEIEWRVLDSTVFTDARARNKPILIVAGNRSSRIGRQIDRVAFRSPDVTDRIARSFIAVRVDNIIRPDLSSTFLPFTRGVDPRDEMDPGFQMWFLDPEGRQFYQRTKGRPDDKLGVAEIASTLDMALARLVNAPDGRRPGDAQREDLMALLAENDEAPPPFSNHLRDLLATADPVYGGWLSPHGKRPYPQALEYLLATQGPEAAARQVAPMLQSGMVDWIHGGFFNQANARDWSRVEFDKHSLMNADLATFLAKLYGITRVPVLRYLALATFDHLAETMTLGTNIVHTYQIGDETLNNRSRRSSVTPRQLSDLFTGEERMWVEEHLNLNPSQNPDMLPMFRDLDAFTEHEAILKEVLDKVRSKREIDRPTIGQNPVADVSASCVARLLEVARLLRDDERMARAQVLFLQLTTFTKDFREVTRVPYFGTGSPEALLSDYLGVADACWQSFLTSGDDLAFRDGLRILLRALELYATETEGILSVAKVKSTVPRPPDTITPEVVDRYGMAASARALLLAAQYRGYLRLFGKNPDFLAQRERLDRFVSQGIFRLGSIGGRLRARCSGLFLACWRADQDQFALVLGPGAVNQARTLSGELPEMQVVPGTVRLDRWVDRAPGLYLVRGGEFFGPMSVDELRLRSTERLPTPDLNQASP